MVLKHINNIEPVCTSHGVGEKRVIATQAEIGHPVTQIARTVLSPCELVEDHLHPSMDEHFFFLDGNCTVIVDGHSYLCQGGDYLFVPAAHSHRMEAAVETTIITIGIETNEK